MRVNHRSPLAHAFLVTMTALSLASVTVPAAAAEPDDAAKQQARELMTRGRHERTSADLPAALKSFTQADEIMRVPTTGLEVARTMTALGMLAEALEVAERVASLPETAEEPEQFAAAREAARDLRSELEARTPLLRLGFSHEPPASTRLTLDGMPVELSLASDGIRVNPGQHVAIAAQGGATRKHVVDLAESATLEVTFDFGAASAAPPSTGSRKAATVTRTSTFAIYGLSGLAVAGGGAALGLALWGNQLKSELERTCAPQCSEKSVGDVRSRFIGANVAGAIGAAAAVAAITVYFVRPDEAKRTDRAGVSSLSLAANAGAEPGLALAGAF